MKILPYETINIEITMDEARAIQRFLYEKTQGQYLNDKFKGCKPIWDLYDICNNFIAGP